MPYAESICNNDPNVFFCEDFQDSATLPRGGNNSCNGIWPNPAWARSNYCFAVDATAGTDPKDTREDLPLAYMCKYAD